jgi:hypothetical protein
MNHQLDQTQGKKTYEPPQLTTISLRPEEAVLGHCKIMGQSMPGGICGLTCSDAGS